MAGPRFYRIRVDGTLGSRFTDSFGAMHLGSEGATTVLSGVCPDASALYGVLDRLEEFGMQLLEVQSYAVTASDAPGGRS